MKKCPKCGKELDVDDKRCPNCGIYLFPKRLFRSSGDSKIFGICGGIGEHFNVRRNCSMQNAKCKLKNAK